MEIDWNAFFLVFAASIVFSLVVVSAFSFGVRLYTNAELHRSASKKGNQQAAVRELVSLTFSYMCFAIATGALLYGIYLVVPFFHKA